MTAPTTAPLYDPDVHGDPNDVTHIEEMDDPDRSLCGLDLTGYQWVDDASQTDPDCPVCAAIEEAEEVLDP